jgi:hypothetical protein
VVVAGAGAGSSTVATDGSHRLAYPGSVAAGLGVAAALPLRVSVLLEDGSVHPITADGTLLRVVEVAAAGGGGGPLLEVGDIRDGVVHIAPTAAHTSGTTTVRFELKTFNISAEVAVSVVAVAAFTAAATPFPEHRNSGQIEYSTVSQLGALGLGSVGVFQQLLATCTAHLSDGSTLDASRLAGLAVTLTNASAFAAGEVRVVSKGAAGAGPPYVVTVAATAGKGRLALSAVLQNHTGPDGAPYTAGLELAVRPTSIIPVAELINLGLATQPTAANVDARDGFHQISLDFTLFLFFTQELCQIAVLPPGKNIDLT